MSSTSLNNESVLSTDAVDKAFDSRGHREAKRLLEAVGIRQMQRAHVQRPLMVVVIVCIAVFTFCLKVLRGDSDNVPAAMDCQKVTAERYSCLFSMPEHAVPPFWVGLKQWNWKDSLAIALSAVTGGAVFLGIVQWNISNKHVAFDNAFERKKRTNDMIITHPKELSGILGGVFPGAEDDATLLKRMFVFSELDNLEYVFEKYRDGLLAAKPTLRSALIMYSRCEDRVFAELALDLVKKGRYRKEYQESVRTIAESAKPKLPVPTPAPAPQPPQAI
jgi:hypothetical protein